MERDFAAYLFTLFCPLFTSGASFSIAHEYSVRNLNLTSLADDGDLSGQSDIAQGQHRRRSICARSWVGWGWEVQQTWRWWLRPVTVVCCSSVQWRWRPRPRTAPSRPCWLSPRSAARTASRACRCRDSLPDSETLSAACRRCSTASTHHPTTSSDINGAVEKKSGEKDWDRKEVGWTPQLRPTRRRPWTSCVG